MALASPVVIASSSPPSFRVLSVTPPHTRKTPSSPSLPSPSTFVRSFAKGLKSGSRIQPVPDGAKLGFASAGNLWREQLEQPVEEPRSDALDKSLTESVPDAEDKAGKTLSKSEGQLKRPSKGHSREEELPQAADAVRWDGGADLPSRSQSEDQHHILEPSNSGKKDAGQDVAAKPKTASTTSKKKSEPGDNARKASKPQRRKIKSAAIILNSDDPGEAQGVCNTLDGKAVADAGEIKALETPSVPKKPRAKSTTTRKPKNKSKATAEAHQKGQRLENHESKSETHETGDNPMPERSHYFSPATALAAECSERAPETEQIINTEHAPALVPRSRRSWTPVKDTVRRTTAGAEISESESLPQTSLAAIIGNMGYVPPAETLHTSAERTASGEAVTKRRRIELTEFSVAGATAVPAPDVEALKQASRSKARKKKPQTITAIATAAFQPPKAPEDEVVIPSIFFQQKPDLAGGSNAQSAASTDAPPTARKPKKARKRRIKIIDGDKTPASRGKTPKSKKSTSAKKKKKAVKFKEPKQVQKLYSPSQAAAHIKKQDFIFGTSSQLAPAESSQFVRDLQAAIHESEQEEQEQRQLYEMYDVLSSPLLLPSQKVTSAYGRSSTKVATAPHGTCLSIDQGARELWSVASRDFSGGLLLAGESLATEVDGETEDLSGCADDSFGFSLPDKAEGEEREASPPRKEPPVDVVELNTSPVLEPLAAELQADNLQPDLEGRLEGMSQCNGDPPAQDDDSWTILRSEDSNDSPVRNIAHQPSASLPQKRTSHPQLRTFVPRATSSPFAKPRSILHPLDSNVKMISHFDSHLDKSIDLARVRTFSTTASADSREAKRPRGRPRKTSQASEDVVIEKKQSSTTPKPTTSPRKPPKLKRPVAATSPAKRSGQNKWQHIDEISDSDAPTTPSPPRRKASATPPAVQPLTLSPSGSQHHEPEVSVPTVSAGQTLKPDSPHWPAVRTAIFPVITKTVKSSTPLSKGELSWWGKILMYDPIVVEDLTEWLKEQGVRIKTTREKKVVKAAKKRKAVDAEEETPQYEEVEESLPPWVVQKWCEENSVCCYLRNGSWRGGRTKS